MANKPARTITEQLNLLKQRGMLFRNENQALNTLSKISYYRLKGYWWDMQDNYTTHTFKPNCYFEEIVERYEFDRQLRLILFDAIERIEIVLRTKMIYHLSIKYGGLWYLDDSIFSSSRLTFNNVTDTLHHHTLRELNREFNRSKEIFIVDQKRRYPNNDSDAWKILEVASLGVLSKLYKSLDSQLPEKAIIAKEMGLNINTELSSWLESITYVRNIIAHHSRLWSRTMVKRPTENINNPINDWLSFPLTQVQKKKPFLIITTMVYLTNHIMGTDYYKNQILNLFKNHPNIPIYKIGFLNNWKQHNIWK